MPHGILATASRTGRVAGLTHHPWAAAGWLAVMNARPVFGARRPLLASIPPEVTALDAEDAQTESVQHGDEQEQSHNTASDSAGLQGPVSAQSRSTGEARGRIPRSLQGPSDGTLTRTDYVRLLSRPDGHLFVAVSGTQVVGYVEGEVVTRSETPIRLALRVFYIHQLCVADSARHQGHGHRLMAAMGTCAAELGVARVELDTWAFNREAQGFFLAEGFRVVNIRMARDE